MLIGGSVDPTNFNDLVHAPLWTQEVIDNGNKSTPSRIQWFHEKIPCGAGADPDCIIPEDETRQLDKIIMTNADIALVRDLEDNMASITLGSGEVVEGSVETCQFRCGGNNRLTGCPNSNPPLCPIAVATFDKATEYKFDNGLFIRDFEAVLGKMLNNGYGDGELVEVSEITI
jgi:hypothetical protein